MGTAGQLTFINGLLPETTSVIKRLAGNRVVHRACDQYGREADSDGCFHGPCMFNKDNFKPYDPHSIFARVVLPPSANMPPPPPRLPATTHAHAQVHEQEVRGRFNYIHSDPPRSPAGPQGAEPRPVARVLFRSPAQGVGEPATFTAKEGPQQPTAPAPAQEPVTAAPTPGQPQPPSTRRPRKKKPRSVAAQPAAPTTATSAEPRRRYSRALMPLLSGVALAILFMLVLPTARAQDSYSVVSYAVGTASYPCSCSHDFMHLQGGGSLLPCP